jgi:hypothetical protein
LSKGDELFERGAALLEKLSRKAASEGGFAAKLAEPLAEDAQFLRQIKPTIVMARLRGEAPTDGRVEAVTAVQTSPPWQESPPEPAHDPPRPPWPEPAPKKEKKKGGGPNPIVIAAAAFAVGVVVAKIIDWRGHAHPHY